jgi:hypothetical protein
VKIQNGSILEHSFAESSAVTQGAWSTNFDLCCEHDSISYHHISLFRNSGMNWGIPAVASATSWPVAALGKMIKASLETPFKPKHCDGDLTDDSEKYKNSSLRNLMSNHGGGFDELRENPTHMIVSSEAKARIGLRIMHVCTSHVF